MYPLLVVAAKRRGYHPRRHRTYNCGSLQNVRVLLRHGSGADPEIFQRGVEEENFERKMFADTRINACTHKN